MAVDATFYFYDLETSDISPRAGRIMQFGGQRTDMQLNTIGEPDNILIKMTDDVVPDPYAILVTGITPQQTQASGITEAEFLRLFTKRIATPGTIFVGYNSVRFDDEFMRFMLYRNFYDAYEWQYKDNRSRWDLLDVIRMTRALRPEGISWPDKDGKPTNRLELLTKANKISHDGAHDALSDVRAVIDLARLIQTKQPKLFQFLLNMRSKTEVAKLVDGGQPFIYTSGKYANEFQKTTIVAKLADHPKRQGALVYDLRYDPNEYSQLSPDQLVEAWRRKYDEPGLRLPVKTLQYNRCPAVAPLGVLDDAGQERLQLSVEAAQANLKKLRTQKDFVDRILRAVGLMDEQQALKFANEPSPVDGQLYDGFFSDSDRKLMRQVPELKVDKLTQLQVSFRDKRLKELLPLYKARNFPAQLTETEHNTWERYRQKYLLEGGKESRLARYFRTLEEIKQHTKPGNKQGYLLEELQLYGESLIPEPLDEV